MMFLPFLALFFLFAGAGGSNACGTVAEPCEAGGGAYVVEIPAAPPPHQAIVFLHGYGGTGAGVLRNRTMIEAALARGYAVVAPQGAPRREGVAGGAWNSFASPERRDDIAFIKAVAEDSAARFGLDRGKMLLAGFSGGGMMSWRVACDAPESFDAYAPIAGLLWRPLPTACGGPVRMLHVHGWADPVVPLEGRAVAGGRITQGDLFAGLDLMRAALGCARDEPDGYGARGAYLLRRWTDCAPGANLELALHPAGHRIPSGWASLALNWFETRPEND
ncbi:polyhydroxybutyrate depolymerase [Pikeienuella piscinae]|uniref:Polyhydroxybutyrate depolymerase n=1 Tax=Pikeienuella piscinae TaxID=2748098 RepID=A0A7L5BZY9_9RHOB|nr:polyhydroxybutyrate depolymerase [Pikeienuella piscinae]QIE55434.1 polyhydroxybutyrate depolymerase [Pikeienuella piscinae]